MYKVFVYGTLKRGEPNHYWLTNPNNGNGTFVANGQTINKYPLIIGTKYNIPFLLYQPGTGHHVKGEIYEVDDKMLKNLDVLEDHPNFYERTVENIKIIDSNDSKNNNIEQCLVYFLKKFKPQLLEQEFFMEYKNDGAHNLKYCERYLRDPKYDHINDVYNKT